MTTDAGLPMRLAHTWVGLYTRNAPPDDAANRREEVASDVFEQVAAGRAEGKPERRIAAEVGRRALRGVPSDLAWRLEVEQAPGRLAWHVDHPATVLTLSLVVLLPLGVGADVMREGESRWRAAGLVGILVVLGYALVAAFALVALGRSRGPLGAHGPWTARRARRALVCTMSFCWALSGVWRFTPGLLDLVATVAWMGFGLALLGYAALVLGGASRAVLRSARQRA